MPFPIALTLGLAAFAIAVVAGTRLGRQGLQGLNDTQKVALVDQLARRRSTGVWISLALVVGYFVALTHFQNRRAALLGYFVVAAVLVGAGVRRSRAALTEAGITGEQAQPFRTASLVRVAGLALLFAGVWFSVH